MSFNPLPFLFTQPLIIRFIYIFPLTYQLLLKNRITKFFPLLWNIFCLIQKIQIFNTKKKKETTHKLYYISQEKKAFFQAFPFFNIILNIQLAFLYRGKIIIPSLVRERDPISRGKGLNSHRESRKRHFQLRTKGVTS